ncbi:MAG: hypothetical protein Kow00120_28050 [Anaerolineae bacterium]
MLTLGDLFHLPQVDALVAQMAAGEPGLVVVAGLDLRPESASPAAGSGLLPSGRATIFRILMREFLAADEALRATVVTEDRSVVRLSRQLRDRVAFTQVRPPYSYRDLITVTAGRQPGLLVVDHLSAETAPAALEAAQRGVRVLSQLDTVFRGVGVVRHLLDLGVTRAQLGGLAWVVAVQRLAALCPACREPLAPSPAQLERLHRLYPNLDALRTLLHTEAGGAPDQGQALTFFHAPGCHECGRSGRKGDVAVFDIFHAGADADLLAQPSALPAAVYALQLALLGHLALQDVLQFEEDEFRRVYNQFVASERAMAEANAAVERKLVELEAANRVLEQRTRALVSLQEFGQALISSTDLDELAARVCHHARDLCGADRAILYFQHAAAEVEVLAVAGWEPELLHQRVAAGPAFGGVTGAEPVVFNRWPPGIQPRDPDVEGAALRAGLCAPLIAEGRRVGVMVLHATRKSAFAPGEVALLQTFAHQAALAIQRAELIAQLQTKVAQLQAAQAELAQKERMERELELARQVQQSVLPRRFPYVPGYRFAARNEPARQVGGDFYDVIRLDDDHFGVAVADVSDKGMPAALYMALTRSLLLAEARRERSPRTTLANVNQLLLELGEPNMFVTVFYGVVACSARRLTYTRAGHDRPLLLRGGTVTELGGRGVALGLFDREALTMTEEELDLEAGDRLVLYTDGLTDALALDGGRFDRVRLKALLQTAAGQGTDALCAAVFSVLGRYQAGAEQYDDMTLLVMGVEV